MVGVKIATMAWENYLVVSMKLNLCISYNLETLHLGIHPAEMGAVDTERLHRSIPSNCTHNDPKKNIVHQ